MTPSWVPLDSLFFLTLCCRHRNTNTLAHPPIHQTLLKTVEILEQRCRLHPLLFLSMPDHLHAITAFHRDARMVSVIGDLKRFLAREHGIEWQEGFFDHRIRNQAQLNGKWDYIEQNPVRKGLVAKPEDWSFRWQRVDWIRR